MKNLLKLTLFVFLLTILFVNVITSINDKSNHFSLENLVALNVANAEGGGDPVSCCCPMLWGTHNCRADNYGFSCTLSGDCTQGDWYCSLFY